MKISSLLPSVTAVGAQSPAQISPAQMLIEEKHAEYANAAKFYKYIYYSTRLLAGLSAGLLPFVVSVHPQYALVLSIVIVICTVVDLE